MKSTNYELCNSINFSITSSLLQFIFLNTLLLNFLKLYSFLNIRNKDSTVETLLQNAASKILIRDRVISVPVLTNVTEVTCKQTTVTHVKTFWEGRNEWKGEGGDRI